MFTSENNWYGWEYDGIKFSRQQGGQEFTTFFSEPKRPARPFAIELRKTAESVLGTYPGLKPCVMFSGGVDSEVIVRTFLEIGETPEIFIFRYENDINIKDVSYAVSICCQYDLKYNLIDFNLKKFYENDAEAISEKAQIDRPRALPQLKFMDYCDGLPIYGASDLSINRTDDDYTKQGTWVVTCWEHDISWSKYALEIDRPAVMEWYKWTPQLVASYMQTQWCNDLVSDSYYGKLGTNSTKIAAYREAYPWIVNRKKMTGFENGSDEMIAEFEKFLIKKYNGQPYRNECVRLFSELQAQLLIE